MYNLFLILKTHSELDLTNQAEVNRFFETEKPDYVFMAAAMVGEGTSYADLTHTVELTTEEYGIGCRKGSDLAAYINDQLKAFYADGSMQEIAKTYGVQDAIIEP